MKESKNFSLFRIACCLLLTHFFESISSVILISLYLFCENKKETAVYLLFEGLLYLTGSEIANCIGRLLDIYTPIYDVLYNRIDLLDPKIQSTVRLLVFNENDYSNSFFLGYGMSSFYFLRKVTKHNNILGLVLIIVFILCFGFELKYLILLVQIVINKFKCDKNKANAILMILILFIESDLKNNFSLLFTGLLILSASIETNIGFRTSICIFESVLFGSFNLCSLVFYEAFVNIRIILYLFSIITLFFPSSGDILFEFTQIYSSFLSKFSIEITGNPGWFIFFFYVLFIYLFQIKEDIIQMMILVLLISCPISYPYASVSFIDVGQGDAILLNGRFNRNTVLIDTGSSYNSHKLERYLNLKGIKEIDALIITHSDEDHDGNKEFLIENYQVNELVVKGKDIINDDFEIEYIPLGNYENDNDNSLVYKLKKNGMTFLFTGDISDTAERELIKQNSFDVDILKVSHHGSDTSSSEYFISKILPKISVISTNGKYGHPSEVTLSTLNRYGSEIFITKEDGTIEFIFVFNFCIVKTNNEWFVII